MTNGREEGGRRKDRGSRTHTLSTKENIPKAALILLECGSWNSTSFNDPVIQNYQCQ